MTRRFLVSALLVLVPTLMNGCSSSTTSPPAGTGGATKTGGNMSATGGSGSGSGGATTSTGGNSSGSGGAVSASGGAVSASGGSSAGGNAAGGAAAGGSASGGAAAGGAKSGGTSGAGGVPATGGTTGGAGGTASGGARTGGSNGAGGAVAMGGTTGAGGSTGTPGCDVWVGTDGSDTNDGKTSATAVATLAHGYDLLCPPVTGAQNGAVCSGTLTTMCIKSGTYTVATRLELKKTRMGTASRILTIQGDPSSTTKPVLDFSTQPRVSCGANPTDGNLGGITMNADYWAVKHLEIKGANDNCVKVQGSHDLVEDVVVHGCADCGIQISDGSGYTNSGTNNLVLNCDSYENSDPQCNGGNADGFCAKENKNSGVDGNVFRGCRSWDNADDGFDFYGWTSPITVDNSWTISMSKTTGGSASNGNGFKLGGNKISAAHVLKDLYATDNKYASKPGNCGFTNNSNPASMTCSGTCAAWGNTTQVQGSISGVGTTAPGSATAAKMIAAPRNADGSLPNISSL